VAWFQSQRGGASQPHSPKVCLPAAGWIPQETSELTVESTAGPLTVNRYLVAQEAERAVVLYWYQTPRRTTTGEWASKLWLMADSIRDQRTDTALVRIIVYSGPANGEIATAEAARFAGRVYPLLRKQFPSP
jgi:EpsI family protein